MKEGLIKIKKGYYKYKGYNIRFHGYYPLDHCVWWEAINEETQCADYHCHTLRQIIQEIDEDLKK